MGNDSQGQTKPKAGMTVEITPRTDRTGKTLIKGVIAEILTKSENHPHGILVKLSSGEIGRIKNILDASPAATAPKAVIATTQPPLEASLKVLIEKGENPSIEFKDRALWSVGFTAEDIKNHKPQSKELHAYGQAASKFIIAKVIAGFLNSNGGTLIIGLKENKQGTPNEIVGVEGEYAKLKDGGQDGYRRMIVDVIKDYFPTTIFNHLDNYLRISFEAIDGHTICGLIVSKSDKKVFLKVNGKDHFFIRTDATTRELIGEEVVDYCQKRFS